MHTTDFTTLLLQLDALTPVQRQTALDHLQHPPSLPVIISRLEQQLQQNFHCPHCQHASAVRWGTLKGMQRYRCRQCRRTFTALTGTPLARLRKREQWLDYARSMLRSEVLRVAAVHCQINLTTSFRWRHRFLKLADRLNGGSLTGIVEADQTLFRESFKGQRHIEHRAPRKRGNARSREARWIPVLVARDRAAAEADFVMPHFTVDNLKKCLAPRLGPDIVLCTDGHLTFEVFAAGEQLQHEVINASQGEKVRKGVFHIQGVNNYHQQLKGWMVRFHGVATRYLNHYLGWFRWFNQHAIENRQPVDFIEDLVGGRDDQQLTPT